MAFSSSQARVVSFSVCSDPGCPFGDDLHLAIRKRFVDLKTGNAVAISYTWGEFCRTATKIGHFEDGSDATMILGAEWLLEFPNLIAALGAICTEINEYCWIDQLSIVPEDGDAGVRALLAKIPDIYRNFDVVVLLPGAVCECVRETYRQNLGHPSPADPPALVPSFHEGPFFCWNNIGFENWFRRLWTRQELLYARSVRVRWTSQDVIQCPLRVREAVPSMLPISLDSLARIVPNLNVTAKLRFLTWSDSLNLEGQTPMTVRFRTEIRSRFVNRATVAASQARLSLSMWSAFHLQGVQKDIIYPFLCGDTLADKSEPDFDRSEQSRVKRFLVLLEGITTMDRSTTHDRDLVVSLWVDCPRYALPADYKQMGLASLMEDAICQLERNWGISLVTSMPRGLLDDSAGSEGFLWRPTGYAQPTTRTQEAYSVLATAYYPYKLNAAGKLPLTLKAPVKDLSRSMITDYEDAFGKLPVSDVFDFLESVCQHWKNGLFMQGLFDRGDERKNPAFHAAVSFLSYRVNRKNQVVPVGDRISMVLEMEEARMIEAGRGLEEHHLDFVQWMVCGFLGIDDNLARQKGLRVMVDFGSEGQPPRLGLSRMHYQHGTAISTYTICAQPPGFGPERHKDIMFEVLIEGGYSCEGLECSNYQVVGVWVQPASYGGGGVHGYVPTILLLDPDSSLES